MLIIVNNKNSALTAIKNECIIDTTMTMYVVCIAVWEHIIFIDLMYI